jgi:hypothetical protein
MNKSVRLASVLAAALIAGLWTTASVAAPKHAEKSATPKPELYTVVQIGDEVQVIKKSELTNLRKTTAEEDKKAKKDYDEAKKSAAKSKDKSDLGKPPVKRSVKVLKDSLKSEQDAQEWMEKHPVQKKDDVKTGKKTVAR